MRVNGTWRLAAAGSELRDSVYSAFKSMYGVEIAQMRGKASKITYTQRELSRLQPVFSRFVELCNVNKVAASQDV